MDGAANSAEGDDDATTLYYRIDTRFIPCGSATPVNDSLGRFQRRQQDRFRPFGSCREIA